MKKAICTLISTAIIVLSLSVSFPAFAQEIEMKRIENFSENCVELVREYDEGKDFETVDEETDELDDLQFQAARLFVKCSSKFDKMGAEEVVSGFQNWHILQYDSSENAKKAYQHYMTQKKIECVEPDVPLYAELDATDKNTYVTREEFNNDYSKKILGTNEVLQYIKENNIKTSEIKVGVIDSGVDYNHELFEDRFFRTYFNATPEGNENDEFDSAFDSHGTSVASCIISVSPNTTKIAVYKATAKGGNFDTKISWILASLIEAYTDRCDIINMSLSFSPISEIIRDVLKRMNSNGITIFTASGNDNVLSPYGNQTGLLCQNENVIAVGASEIHNRCANFSNKGHFLAFFAPGNQVAVAVGNNKYMLRSGTSFSSPYAAGIFAILKSLDSDFSNEKIVDLMKYTCMDVFHAFNHDNVWYGKERYGSGVLDAWRAFSELQNIKLISDVKFSIPTGEINIDNKLSLACAENCEIYYTTDLTVASKKNGIKYTEPITITEDTVVNAIAYDKNGNRGQNQFEYYIAFETGDENDFVIDDNGTIIGYNGEVRNLEIPETIKGKTVTGFHYDLFSGKCKCEGIIPAKNTVTALKLPKTIEYLENDTWLPDIESFSATGLKEIPDYGFSPEGKTLTYLNAVNVEKIGVEAFKGLYGVKEFYFPNCVEILDRAFAETYAYHLYLPKLKYFYDTPLENAAISNLYCPIIEYGHTVHNTNPRFVESVSFLFQLFLPKIKTISYSGLDCNDLKRIEFSEIESLLQFPRETHFKPTTSCALILPLSLKEIDLGYQDGNLNFYTIYGTKGSYAQQWAEENNIEFIELNQNTAVYTDVRETCNEYTETLFFDSLGFHKSYQWYGSYDNSTDNGIAIDGADKELFHIQEYKSYPYYYCVCTSTDIGDGKEHVENIYSKVCHNIDYVEVEEPTTEETTGGLTEPSTEPSTEQPSKPTDTTAEDNTSTSTTASETTKQTTKGNSSNETSTTVSEVKKNNSKTSPQTGIDNRLTIAISTLSIFFALLILIRCNRNKKET